jgi:hypothetical protein
MNTTNELNHSVLQKLIILFFGLMTFAIFMQSCTHIAPCSAYDQVELQDDLPTE